MNKLWVVKEPKKNLQEKVSRELGISPVLTQLLINRNLTASAAIERFLNCRKSNLHNPFKLKDIGKATERIKKAIREKEKILIYGDYDVDGITGVALLYIFLKRKGARVSWYIPNRLDEGYGLNLEAARFIESKGISLLITVDCGTTDKEEVNFLNRHGIDTLVVDHHRPQRELLCDAFCMINPWQSDCGYPFKELSAVGLVYKLVCALSEDINHSNEEFLDLVALGTVADVAPQIDENRILTKFGLERLSETRRIGIKALIDAAGLRRKDIQTDDIGFIIGPRINVGGRIGSPEVALRLILSESQEEAKELAEILNQENSFRQKLQEEILKEAVSKVEGEFSFKRHKVIVIWGQDWHPGVIGIVASKIADRFYRPAIVLNVQDGIAKGSGRSIENFHLFDAVYKCKGLLENFGGHEAACGLTILKDNIEKFRESINIVAHNMLTPHDLIPKIEVDMELPLSSINRELINELKLLEPFGNQNPQPLFLSTNLNVKGSPTQFGRNGVKMWVTDKRTTCEAVSFNGYDMLEKVRGLASVDLVYYPKIRQISGVDTLKLEIEDFKGGLN